MADALQETLRAACFLIFARVEIQPGLDILADLIVIGFDRCVTGIRSLFW